jgi:DNA-binding FadR family transcriptional regulator
MAGQDREPHASKVLADALRAQISSGAYPAGARLPSYRQLRHEHDVALNTAQAPIRLLAADGLVEIRPGSGAYARDASAEPTRPLRVELTELRAALRKGRQDLAAAEEKVARLLSRLGPDRPVE